MAGWPGGRVPVYFAVDIPTANQDKFFAACREWEAVANVRFYRQTTENDRDCVRIVNNNVSNNVSNTSTSTVGKPTGAQPEIRVGANHWNLRYILCHEIGHTLGLIHEHQRSDQSTFIQVEYRNVQAPQPGEPDPQQFFQPLGSENKGPYDFDSVIHYGAYFYSANPAAGLRTITPLEPASVPTFYDDVMGRIDHLSQLDRAGMQAIYGTAGTWVDVAMLTDSTTQFLMTYPDYDYFIRLFNVPASLSNRTFFNFAPGYNHPIASAVGPDKNTRVLRRHSATAQYDGAVEILVLRTQGIPTNSDGRGEANLINSPPLYGPFPGWSPVDVAAASDNKGRVLWNFTDGRISLWTISATGVWESWVERGPIPGWYGKAVAVGTDSLTRILWNHFKGYVMLWHHNSATGGYTYTVFDPGDQGTGSKFYGQDVATSPVDNTTRILYVNAQGMAMINTMVVNAAGAPELAPGGNKFYQYGAPADEWKPLSISTGYDNKTRLIWKDKTSRLWLWIILPDGTVENTRIIG